MSTSTNTNQQENTQKKPEKKRCNGGCGFWGNPDLLDYCSVCFKKCVPEDKRIEQTKKIEERNKTNVKNSDNKDTNKLEDNKPKKKIQKKKNRCFQCNKKMTLAGTFECKCGYRFCGVHRYADAHECDFDFKTQQNKKLKKQLDKVVPDKLQKI